MQIESHLEFVFCQSVYVSWSFEVVSVTVALYTKHLVRHLPSRGRELFFCQQLHS